MRKKAIAIGEKQAADEVTNKSIIFPHSTRYTLVPSGMLSPDYEKRQLL